MIIIIKSISEVDNNSAISNEVVKKEHENFISVANWNIMHNKSLYELMTTSGS